MPTQHTDIYNPAAPAINYAGPGKTWTIANGVLVGSGVTTVYSLHNGSKLVNNGDIFSPGSGVTFQAQKNGTVINKAGASIVGSYGVILGSGAGGKNMTVMNDGTIVAVTGVGVYASDVSNFDLTNTGKIFGPVVGVQATVVAGGATDGPTIDNSGLIKSANFGIYGSVLPGLTTTVHNKPGGTIQGAVASIYIPTGKLSLDNDGKIKGNVVASGANTHDKVVNAGQIKGEVFLGSGNDTFKNAGGTAGRIHGGDGNDTLIAGPHKDQFVFDTALNPATNVDRVKHFDPGTDKLILDQTFFPTISGLGTLTSAEFHKGTQAHDADDRIIYNKTTGALIYDSNGDGGGGDIQFAKLDKGLNLHASDFVVIA